VQFKSTGRRQRLNWFKTVLNVVQSSNSGMLEITTMRNAFTSY